MRYSSTFGVYILCWQLIYVELENSLSVKNYVLLFMERLGYCIQLFLKNDLISTVLLVLLLIK